MLKNNATRLRSLLGTLERLDGAVALTADSVHPVRYEVSPDRSLAIFTVASSHHHVREVEVPYGSEEHYQLMWRYFANSLRGYCSDLEGLLG